MNAKKAKALRRKAAILANIPPMVAQTYTAERIGTERAYVTHDGHARTFTITPTLRLIKGCFREIYRDFKKFARKHPNRSIA